MAQLSVKQSPFTLGRVQSASLPKVLDALVHAHAHAHAHAYAHDVEGTGVRPSYNVDSTLQQPIALLDAAPRPGNEPYHDVIKIRILSIGSHPLLSFLPSLPFHRISSLLHPT